MEPIKTEAFDLALKFINETNVNIFLTGKAGTGKTTFLKYLKENPVKSMAIAAPTGVAAINAGGVTLHSMFQLPFGPFIPETNHTAIGFDKKSLLSRMRFNSEKLNFFNVLELLVIDEASMVAAHTIDAIDTILRAVRHKQVPFGGVQVLFIGDLYQLQPVVKDDERQVLKNYYSSNFFFDSLALRNNVPVMIELKTIFRQKDERFIDILNGLRENNLTKEHLQDLNGRMKPDFISNDGDGYITLTTHNHTANTLNEIKLNRLKGRAFKFNASVDGEFPDHMKPAEIELTLKRDAQVMFIKNDSEGKRYYNGKIGVISQISEKEIVVDCDGDEIPVQRHVWENTTYSVDPVSKEIKENLVGTFTQYPLRLAWAITIHKSQGLTFDKVVIDAENAFANGQVYVALSRATALEGLILTSTVNDRFLGPHADLKNWQETKQDEKSLPVLFEKARQDYIRLMMFNVFSLESFNYQLERLRKELEEYKEEKIYQNWLVTLIDNYQNLNATAIRFKSQLQILWNEGGNSEVNEKLNTRIAEGARYFTGQLTEWKSFISEHPLKINVKKDSRAIDKSIGDINEQIIGALTKMNLCKDGFVMNEMLIWKKHLPKNIERIKSTYTASEAIEAAEKHSSLFSLLASYRDEIAAEEDVLPYMIFSNLAIRNCCQILPGDKQALLTVGGFGKQRVNEYGNDVLKIIRIYCEENNLQLNYNKGEVIGAKKKSEGISPTIKETVNLFNSGKNVTKISAERKLAQSTIEGHLAIAVKNDLIKIDQIFDERELEYLLSYFDDGGLELKNARAKSDGNASYSKLRIVQAWLIAKKEHRVF